MLGYVGQLTAEALRQFDLRGPTTVAEIRLSPLVEAADLVPRCVAAIALSGRDPRPEPGGRRGGPLGRRGRHGARQRRPVLRVAGIPRHVPRPRAAGRDKKSLLFSIALRSAEGTLTSQQADEVRDRIVAACRAKHGAELRA